MNTGKFSIPSVLHIVGSSAFGGGTMVVFSLIKEAQKRGWKVAILSDDPATIAAAQETKIDIVKFHGIIHSIRPWTDIAAINRLAKLLKERKDTIVHTHTQGRPAWYDCCSSGIGPMQGLYMSRPTGRN
jgi:molybdopterin-guanine dinucleotide biosynthesis protein